MISTIIVDNEVHARQKLRHLLSRGSDIELVSEARTAQEAIDLVRSTQPDLMFLDIEMPHADGFDAIAGMRQHGTPLPLVIFTTAYREYALRAFDIGAIDYLVKPFTEERLAQSLSRVRQRLTASAQHSKQESAGLSDRLVFKSRGKVIFLPISALTWISVKENYIQLHTAQESYIVRHTMFKLERRLDPEKFLRIHRSTIVNLQSVKEICTGPGKKLVVVMKDGHRLAVSHVYRPRIMQLMKS